MKNILKLSLFSLLLVNFALAGGRPDRYPKNPNTVETPGKLCSGSNNYRYPERIQYCERNVDSYTKQAVILNYDKVLGYQIRSMNRQDFKIDHLIPLCAGGANTEDNLWPQHKSVYDITDPLEPVICEKMSQGKLLQADAIKLILKAKLNLDQVPASLKQVQKL